jgi:hypothetical protein
LFRWPPCRRPRFWSPPGARQRRTHHDESGSIGQALPGYRPPPHPALQRRRSVADNSPEVSGSASRTNTSYRRINDSEHADRAAAAKTPGTKQRRIREHILRRAPVTFRLADIRTAVPGVSDQTIRLVLEQLKNEGKVRADGTGRAATWTRMPNTHIPNKRSAPANLSYWDYEGALLVVR